MLYGADENGYIIIGEGGNGSGNFGHKGRKGKRGGSLPKGNSKSGSPKNMYFLSTINKDGETLSPRVPDNFLTRNNYEDNETPRVCFATSVDKALIALSSNNKGKEFYIHVPEKKNKKDKGYDVYKPSKKEVPDVKVTGEVWIKEKVKLKCIGSIIVSDAKDKSLKYTYGDNKTAELYGWNWTWNKKFE